LTLREVSII